MNKQIFMLFLAFICGCLFMIVSIPVAAKGTFGFTQKESYSLFSIRCTDKVSDWVDNETGVHYLAIFDKESLNALCPRYNADGTLMVDKKTKTK